MQKWAWSPQLGPQVEAIRATWAGELFYGGAAGGGKSDFLLGDFLQDVPVYGAAWRGIIFRRTYGELQDLFERAQEIYPQTGATWNEQKHTWKWPNGATLRFRYLEQDKHKTRYQGHSYTWIGWDELTQWPTDAAYRYLRARLRSPHHVPTKRIRATANPGGVGHHWVKAYFVTPAPGGWVPLEDTVTKMRRMFIPAKLTDNAILLRGDPNYADRLRGLGSDALVKAWLDGDWNVVEGAFFDCWSQRNIIAPFTVPRDWLRFRSADWGSASPFSIGWWAVVQDDFSPAGMEHAPVGVDTRGVDDDRRMRDGISLLPRGAIVRYREWYGSTDPATGAKGLKLTAEQVGDGIVQREKELGLNDKPALSYGVLDPSAFREDGGPSLAERINSVLLAKRLAPFHAADNTRVSTAESKDRRGAMGGWDQMRSRIIGADGKPMIYCFDTCVASIRTIPMLQHDPVKAEDLDTNSEDHAADDWRYACMSRPWPKSKPEKPKPEYAYRPGGPHGGGEEYGRQIDEWKTT